MNTNDEKMLNVQLVEEAYSQARLKIIASLDEKINRLRESYKVNQTNIREVEAISFAANEFENLQKRDTEITETLARNRGKLETYQAFEGEIYKISGSVSKKARELKKSIVLQCSELTTQIEILEVEQKQNSVLLSASHKAVKFLPTLEALRNREREIKEEGTRLNEELKSLQKNVAHSKISNLPDNSINYSETQEIVAKQEIVCNVGSKCLRLAEFLFSSKTCREVFYPNIGDWREDYIIALRKGRIFDALFISIKIYINFTYTLILCSKFGKLIEFIMKFADVIEFFNKFSK